MLFCSTKVAVIFESVIIFTVVKEIKQRCDFCVRKQVRFTEKELSSLHATWQQRCDVACLAAGNVVRVKAPLKLASTIR